MQNNGILNVRKRKTKKAQPKLRFFPRRRKRRGTVIAVIWVKYGKALCAIKLFYICAAFPYGQHADRKVRYAAKGKAEAILLIHGGGHSKAGKKRFRYFFQRFRFSLLYLWKVPNGTYSFAKSFLTPVLFKAPFSDDKAAAVHSLISMLMLCTFIPRDL